MASLLTQLPTHSCRLGLHLSDPDPSSSSPFLSSPLDHPVSPLGCSPGSQPLRAELRPKVWSPSLFRPSSPSQCSPPPALTDNLSRRLFLLLRAMHTLQAHSSSCWGHRALSWEWEITQWWNMQTGVRGGIHRPPGMAQTQRLCVQGEGRSAPTHAGRVPEQMALRHHHAVGPTLQGKTSIHSCIKSLLGSRSCAECWLCRSEQAPWGSQTTVQSVSGLQTGTRALQD